MSLSQDAKTEEKKTDYLRGLYETTYLRDVIERNHLRNLHSSQGG